MENIFYNAQHSPIGAFSSFTLGFPGAKGGIGLELGAPANESVFIGVEANEENTFEALPFYKAAEDESKRYEVEQANDERSSKARCVPYSRDAIRRELTVATDTWQAGDLTFRIYSPVRAVPDPEEAEASELQEVLLPAVMAELTVDNSAGPRPRRAFFGYQGSDRYSQMRCFKDTERSLTGIGQGRHAAIATSDPDVRYGQAFTIEEVLVPERKEASVFGLGGVCGLIATVPAGTKKTIRFAVCFHRDGIVTTGMEARYWYTRYFKSIEEVAAFGLENFDTYVNWAKEADERLDAAHLTEDQRFMMAHAIHSYYGSTQFLNVNGRPFWVVNEGEYRMMNTFDLTADQLFFEMVMNPWTVRNELDMYADRFSYRDAARFPGDETEHPGGLSFTHDMGVANSISPPGHSAYELGGKDGCFSYMTHEELVNWICCATVYAEGSGDEAWTRSKLTIFEDCFQSMLNRDHPDPSKRNGVMSLDSSRTLGGAEITTYDSLDASLGQARNNLYLAVKSWAAYVALQHLFARLDLSDRAELAGEQARRCAATLVSHVREDEGGYIPAVLGEGVESRIIPAIEGLVFPRYAGCPEALDPEGRFADMLKALKQHFETVLVPDVCLFEDGGWKISSTSENSWLSKIYLCQFVARQVLGLPWDVEGRAADAAHVKWLTHPELSYWAWSDQIVAGKIQASKYYPRGVTCVLWLEEGS